MPGTIYNQNTDSLSDSMVNIGYGEIKAGLIEALESRKNQHQGDLEKLNSALNQRDYSDLIEIWNKLDSDDELNDASTLADLIAGKIAGFDREQLLEMLDFSKISYGDRDRKLNKDGYKTKRQLAEEGYRIIQFFEDERTENQYCPDEDYKLEQRNYGYDLICSNSWNRDAGYVFIKDREVTIAYHGTRDGSDFKTDLYAYLTKLPFSPEGDSVHSGFYSLFKRSWPSVHKILKGYANDQGVKIKGLKINVTGHSMGGALASIAALCLNKTENAENVHVATFGSPRVFYKDAAKVYNDGCLGNKTIRVACRSDNIPCLPPGGGHEYYKHVGQALKLEANETRLTPDITLHYHRLNTYRNLIKDNKQENFRSDNVPSWWCYVAYPIGKLFSNIPVEVSEDSDKEFFKKVKEENGDIKFSKILKECSPSLEGEFRQREQEVAQLTDEKVQLGKRLNSIQQSLGEKTEELKSTQVQLEQERKGASEKLTQEQQKTSQLNDQVEKLTAEFKGTKNQLAEKKAELDEQTRTVTKLSDTIRELKETNAELERKKSNLTSQLEKFAATNAKLEKNVGNLNNQFAEEKKALEDLKVQSEQNKVELEKKKEELNDTKRKLDSQASRIVEFTAEIEELRKTKTGLEGKAEFAEKELVDAQTQLKENERVLDAAKKNILQLEKDLKQAQQKLVVKTKEFENAVNKLQKGLDEKTSKAAQFEEENSNLASQARELERKCEQTEVQLVASKQKLAEETSKVTQLSKESNEAKAQLEGKKEEIGKLKVQVTQLKSENNDLKTRLQESENKSEVLEKNLQKQFESKNEELNEKFLKAKIHSKRQGNYASVSFVLSGAFAVGTSLTMVHLAMCVSLAVAALAFLAVGCYCSYKANTALNNVKIENDSYRIAA